MIKRIVHLFLLLLRSMDIKGKRIYFAGSASKDTSPSLLKYAHKLVTELVKALAAEGAKFAVQVGKEPLSVENDPTSLSIIFDWTVIATVNECLQQGTLSTANSNEPLIFTVKTDKTEGQIPTSRRELWDALLEAKAVEIEFVEKEFGELRRNVQAERGDILITLSGGSGTESLVSKYEKSGKSVIPLDLQIGSSCNDGSGGALRLAKELLTQPNRFIRVSESNNIGVLLSRLSTRQGERPVTEVTKGVIELIKAIDEIPSIVDVLIITALKDELDALKTCNNNSGISWQENQDSLGYSYYKISLRHINGTDLTIAAASAVDMGETKTTELATRLVIELKPRYLAMTGVCAGDKNEVFLGDVIVADRVFKFDYGKLIAHYQELGEQNIRTEQVFHDITTYNLKPLWKSTIQNFSQDWINTIQTKRPKSYFHQERWLIHKLYDYQKNLETNRTPQNHPERTIECSDWKKVIERLRKQELLKTESFELTEKGIKEVLEERLLHLDDERYRDPSIPQVKIGVIATTSQVQKDPEIFQRLKKLQRKALGVEMEVAAIGSVAEIYDIPMIIVKSVQDYADYDKNDQFRLYASETSAQFLLAFITTFSVISK